MNTIHIERKKFCVYAHSTSERGIFYIGMGTADRPFVARHKRVLWKQIVRKNGGYDVSVLYWTDDKRQALDFERDAIELFAPICNIRGTHRDKRQHWTADEEAILRQNFHNISPKGLRALIPGRSRNAINLKARKMGLAHSVADYVNATSWLPTYHDVAELPTPQVVIEWQE